MKTRLDYVTNSSSSSFLIMKNNITSKQAEAIKKHSQLGKKLGLLYSEDAWDIDESQNFISGKTWMDNFDMGEFFETIGISSKGVIWDSSVSARQMEEIYQGLNLTEQNNDTKYNPNWENILESLGDDCV